MTPHLGRQLAGGIGQDHGTPHLAGQRYPEEGFQILELAAIEAEPGNITCRRLAETARLRDPAQGDQAFQGDAARSQELIKIIHRVEYMSLPSFVHSCDRR